MPTTSLVGRQPLVQLICERLRDAGVRLLTLLGPGGVGKTRISLEVARQMREDFADGVCFVSLAPISDPELVIPTIAQALDLKEVGEQSLSALLQVFLRDKNLLLLLDNFEQVITAAPLLANLLAN